MKTFIFYTAEGVTLSPQNTVCENFQILGFEKGFSQELAFQSLLNNNPWISEYGFSQRKIICRQVI